MRKFIATLIVAVVLGTGFTMGADAAPARSNDAQVERLQQKVKNLRADVRFWRDEVAYLDSELSKAQNKPVYPAYEGAASGNATTVYRVTWSADGSQWVSNPLYTTGQRDRFVSLLSADESVSGIAVQTATVGPWS